MLGALAIERDPLLGLVEQIEDLVALKLADPGEITMRESQSPGGKAARSRWRIARTH
jgi:hypothetical protein